MKFTTYALGLLWIANTVSAATKGCQSIAAIACTNPDFSTLCTAVGVAGLGDALSGGEWTVFAPTNAAFAELGDTLDAVLADTDLLTSILLFHAVPTSVFAADLVCAETVEMANGEDSRTVCAGGSIFQKGAGNPRSNMPEIIATDIEACNGVVHVVDAVMLPPPAVQEPPKCQTITEIACTNPDFSTLCTAVGVAGLGDALSGGEWTVFAPTNTAFAELGDTLDAVLVDTDLLTNILLFHAVPASVFAADLVCAATVEMANGADSRTVCTGGSIFQKGAGNPRADMPEIIVTDIGACNGVVHVVNEVMLP